jgi:hypothetical protein
MASEKQNYFVGGCYMQQKFSHFLAIGSNIVLTSWRLVATLCSLPGDW